MFQLEDAVPLPRPRSRYGSWPFQNMSVGQSFFVPNDVIARYKHEETIRASAHNAGKRYGMKFATQRQPEGIRIWRTA